MEYNLVGEETLNLAALTVRSWRLSRRAAPHWLALGGGGRLVAEHGGRMTALLWGTGAIEYGHATSRRIEADRLGIERMRLLSTGKLPGGTSGYPYDAAPYDKKVIVLQERCAMRLESMSLENPATTGEEEEDA